MPSTKNNTKLTFKPHLLARNRHFQTIYSSLSKAKNVNLLTLSREMILETSEGVRLQGFYAPQPAGQSRGLLLLLHGWLGYARASYITTTGEHLYQQGFSIFRLNLRDHGDTLHLNPGAFRSDLLDEVFEAVQQIAALESNHHLHIVGVSLGGNFVLRLAYQHSQTPLPNLGQTIVVCPVLDPYTSTIVLDKNPLYLSYFRRKWRRAMKTKQNLFPELYDFSEVLKCKSCLDMTDTFIKQYGPYPHARAYFKQYTISHAMLRGLRSPVTIITAADDPFIPVSDFYPLGDLSPYLHVSIQPYGGHVGFVDIFPYRYWISQAISQILTTQD